MRGHLQEIGKQFDELAHRLADLKGLHAGDPDAIAALETAEHAVKRGAGIVSDMQNPHTGG